MGHTSSRKKDHGAERDLNCRDLVQEGSEEKKINMSQDSSCDILVENVTVFCPCPKGLPEAKLKSFGLTALAADISKQPTIDCVACLVASAMQICNKKERGER